MLYVLWSAPSGLLLYWLVGNLVGFSQQMLINRLIKSKDDEPPAVPDKAAVKASKKKLKCPKLEVEFRDRVNLRPEL